MRDRNIFGYPGSVEKRRFQPAAGGVAHALVLGFLAGAGLFGQAAALKYRFSFGPAEPPSGFVQVLPETLYNPEIGYGFEPGPMPNGVKREGASAPAGGFLTSDRPFFFSVKAPEGNYRVKVTLGDSQGESATTVKAELRRLFVENAHTGPGEFLTATFIVNVRTPVIGAGGQVRLKPRERASEIWAWDDRLTLEFSGSQPKVSAVEIEPARDLPTIYIAGDSTSTDQPVKPYNSWGQMLTRFFKPEIAIANNGESGESLRSFISENRLAKILSVIQPGDWLLIQMGHNDQKDKVEGAGAFTSYKGFLEQFVQAARDHGAIPVLITPMNRLTFDSEGKITNSLGDYPDAVRAVAKEKHVGLIDLNAMSKPFYEALGPVEAHVAFAGKDTTHHSDYGSYELAKCIVQGIKDAHLSLAKYLVDTPAFDPAKPDSFAAFTLPPDPPLPLDHPATAERPYGN